MCTFRLSVASCLPYGVCVYKHNSAKHPCCTAGLSDVSSSTIDCWLTGHSIKIFRFSAEIKRKQTDARRMSSKDTPSCCSQGLWNDQVWIRFSGMYVFKREKYSTLSDHRHSYSHHHLILDCIVPDIFLKDPFYSKFWSSCSATHVKLYLSQEWCR